MARKIKKKKAKVIKKRWVSIQAPKLFNNQLIGETYVSDPERAKGKTITTNLMNLTKDPKKQNTYISFNVIGLKENIATTEFKRYKLSPAAVKRAVRRNRDKVGDSFEAFTVDKRKVIVKPLLVTRNKVSKPQQTDIRLKARKYIIYKFSKATVESILTDLISKKFQRGLSGVIKNISKLSMCEIRDFQVVAVNKEA